MKNIKSYLLSFILGGIIFSGITVFAEYVITADKIEYSANISVKDKIDDLYTHVKPIYTGSTTVTPSSNTQTLNTNNKLLNSDITITPIPDIFKDVSDSTVTSASDILSGKTAYLKNGAKVAGTRAECVKGSFVCNTCTSSNGQALRINFTPNMFYIYGNNDVSATGWYYNVSISSTNFTSFNSVGVSNSTLTNRFRLNNDLIVHDFPAGSWEGKTLYYVACK